MLSLFFSQLVEAQVLSSPIRTLGIVNITNTYELFLFRQLYFAWPHGLSPQHVVQCCMTKSQGDPMHIYRVLSQHGSLFTSFCPTDFNYSKRQDLLISARPPCCAWAHPVWTVDFAVDTKCVYKSRARIIIGFLHLYPFSQQSEVLYCLWCSVCKELFHIFCPVFQLFAVGVSLYQLLHDLRWKTLSHRPIRISTCRLPRELEHCVIFMFYSGSARVVFSVYTLAVCLYPMFLHFVWLKCDSFIFGT